VILELPEIESDEAIFSEISMLEVALTESVAVTVIV
jgi:hypothetical protein